MALIVADRVQETSTTTGTGAFTLLGATTGYRSASTVCANGDTFTYYAEDIDVSGRPLGGWETGLGTWGTGNILTRTTVYASSNANAAVNWAAGTRKIGLSLVSQASLGPTQVNSSITINGTGYGTLASFKYTNGFSNPYFNFNIETNSQLTMDIGPNTVTYYIKIGGSMIANYSSTAVNYYGALTVPSFTVVAAGGIRIFGPSNASNVTLNNDNTNFTIDKDTKITGNFQTTGTTTLATSLTGLLKSTSGVVAQAIADTDYPSITTVSGKIASTSIDATGGVPGLTLFKLNLKNAANTFTNYFTNTTTASRTWTLPDKDGTVAMTVDLPTVPTGGTPALTLGTTNAAGSAATYVKTDATILTFDVTAPADVTSSAAGTGSATVAARRDHKHTIAVLNGTTSGIVTAQGSGTTTVYLNGSGAWSTPPDTNTWVALSSTVSGYVTTNGSADTTKFLNANGAWAVPPDTNTWTALSGTVSGYVTTQGASNTALWLNGNGAWSAPTAAQVGAIATGGTAGSVTNSVTFTTTGGAAAGTTYNGSAARTIDYSTVGAAAASHTHAYLSAEADTLATVTARGASTATAITLAGASASYNGVSITNSVAGWSWLKLAVSSGPEVHIATNNTAQDGCQANALHLRPNGGSGGTVLGCNPDGSVMVRGAFSAASKSFLIPHPLKEGKKLRYGSLEGPEHGVYVRGRLKGNTIELPDYWTKLVDPDSITVQLTPIGQHQKLYVKDISNNQVIVGSENLFGSIDCFYIVNAERRDIDKLVVEE